MAIDKINGLVLGKILTGKPRNLHGKIYGFRLRFSQENQSIDRMEFFENGLMDDDGFWFFCILLLNTAWWYRSFWFFAPSPTMWWHKMIDMPTKTHRMSRFDCRIKDIWHNLTHPKIQLFLVVRNKTHIFGEDCCAMLCRAVPLAHWALKAQTVNICWVHFTPFGKHTKNYWTWPLIVDFPIKNGDFPWQTAKLPEGNAGWWFGTWLDYFPFHIWVVILPIDWLTFRRGRSTTNQNGLPKGQCSKGTGLNLGFLS